jgi:pantetheine-phosphate adenylyltransferase
MALSSRSFVYKLVGLGGSFDHLHDGHKELLRTAFRIGKHVAIALTTSNLLKSKVCKENLEEFEVREKNLRNFIENDLKIDEDDYSIIPLNDPFGPAITNKDLEAHISSVETHAIALKINELRIKNGLNPMVLIIIPLIKNKDGKKLSSTDIRLSLNN